jgi:hypothetical protein
LGSKLKRSEQGIKEERILNLWTRELKKIWTFTETGNFISFPKVNAKKPKI